MIVAATLLAVKRFKAMVESVVGIGAVRALVEYEPDSGEDVNNVDAMDDNDSVDIIGYTLDEKDNKIIRTNNSFHLHEEVERSTVSGVNFKTITALNSKSSVNGKEEETSDSSVHVKKKVGQRIRKNRKISIIEHK